MPDPRSGVGARSYDAVRNDCLQVQLRANCRQRDVYVIQSLLPPVQEISGPEDIRERDRFGLRGDGADPSDSEHAEKRVLEKRRRQLGENDRFPPMTARGRLLSGLATMVIALAGFVTFGALPAAANSDNVQYVALGDSYAAGVGAPPRLPVTHCLQSDFGYPGVLNSGKRIVLQVNATCAGATTTAVANTVKSGASGLNPETRLVTLTVGGNDLGFAGLAGACLAGTPDDCLTAIGTAEGNLPDLYRDLTDLYAQVAVKAPDARIVVTGYPFLVEPSKATLVTAFRAATVRLNDTIEQAVAAAREADVKIVYVDVTAAFAGHGITLPPEPETPDPFINAPIPGERLRVEDFHPNAMGYKAYADAISDALPNGWLGKTSRSAASS